MKVPTFTAGLLLIGFAVSMVPTVSAAECGGIVDASCDGSYICQGPSYDYPCSSDECFNSQYGCSWKSHCNVYVNLWHSVSGNIYPVCV